MLSKRIIACLDVRDGRVVKGVRFRDHVDVGDIVPLARRYRDAGADELVFYDIAASPRELGVDRTWIGRVARVLDIPFCVAGGIRSVADARAVLNAGADKVSVNTPALQRPGLVSELAAAFGTQCVVVGIDSQRDADGAVVAEAEGAAGEVERNACARVAHERLGDVHAEGLVGQVAHLGDLGLDVVQLARRRLDDPEAPGLGHRRCQLRAGDPAHRGLDDGDVDAEEVGDAGGDAGHGAGA